MNKCYVIAEAGSCHDGKIEQAQELVKIAADAGANAVKFQYWSDSKALALARHDEKLESFYEPYRMPREWLELLSAQAHAYGLDFMCTVYLAQDIATVAPYVANFKIASPDALNRPFIEAHHQYGKPIIISVGMLTESELLSIPVHRYYLLHCVSAYPCPLDQVNLSVIRKYSLDGFSDHTGHPQMGGWAYLAGARIIEAHIRTNGTLMTNPDYPHSHFPISFHSYVYHIRVVQTGLGDGIKITQPAEAETRKYMA